MIENGKCGHKLEWVSSNCVECSITESGVRGFHGSKESFVDALCDHCKHAHKEKPISKPKVNVSQKSISELEEMLTQAQKDIAAMLFLSGECQYCKHCVPKSVYDATIFSCKLGKGVDCRPEWRGCK